MEASDGFFGYPLVGLGDSGLSRLAHLFVLCPQVGFGPVVKRLAICDRALVPQFGLVIFGDLIFAARQRTRGDRRLGESRRIAWGRLLHCLSDRILPLEAAKLMKVNLKEKLALIEEHWRPKVVGELNGQEVKIVKFQGEFPWHHHENEDEMFMSLKGNFRVEFRDKTVELTEGEFIIVPRGVEHRPVADEEVEVLLFEPAHVLNTGNITDEKYTAPIGDKV